MLKKSEQMSFIKSGKRFTDEVQFLPVLWNHQGRREKIMMHGAPLPTFADFTLFAHPSLEPVAGLHNFSCLSVSKTSPQGKNGLIKCV